MINVFTRFNVHDPAWPHYDVNDQEVLTSEWLDHRLEIFNKFTVPSMRWQKHSFKWTILVHPETDWRITKQLPSEAKVIFTHKWREYIDKHVGVMNFRLDNDDMLMPNALAEVVATHHKGYVVLKSGYKMDYSTGEWAQVTDPNSPFVGRYAGNPYEHTHGRGIRESGVPVVTLGGYKWVQIIHQRNVSNR